MAAKLTSISKQIHWSLLIRAIVFAVTWWYSPAWLFTIIACGVYFVPSFDSKKNLPAFLALIGVSWATAPTILMAVIYGALCYYLLLIKDFYVIDRKSARAMLAIALSFFMFRQFFLSWTAGLSAGSLAWAWIVAFVFGVLVNGVIMARRGIEVDDQNGRRPRRTAVGVATLLIFEVLVICLFLPVDFVYQSIIAFLAAALLLDFVPAYFFHELDLRRIRTTSIGIAALFVIVLASAKWGI